MDPGVEPADLVVRYDEWIRVVPLGTAALAGTLLFALAPRSFTWLLMGGGLPRAFGLAFALLAAREAWLLLDGDRPRLRVALTGVFAALTLLTHLETAAFLAATLVAMGVYCWVELRHRAGLPVPGAAAARRLRDHVAGATIPIAGLVVIALLQNVDVIAAKHRFSTDVASSYSATAVAAKALVWVAMGLIVAVGLGILLAVTSTRPPVRLE